MSNLVSKGCQGHPVRRIQDALNQRMLPPVNRLTRPALAPLRPDSIFGPKTEAMVKEFQRLNRLKPDGIVGPITRLHLFPYVEFEANLAGRGQFPPFRPTTSPPHPGVTPAALRSRSTAFGLQPVSDEKPKEKDEEPQGFVFELFVAKGVELKLKNPWPPKFGPADQTLTVGATLLRLGRLEVSGALEAHKPLKPKSGDNWHWGGDITASYKAVPQVGPVSPLSPFLKLEPFSRAPVSVGIGAEIEILQDILKLTIEGQGSFRYDSDRGRVKLEETTISAGLEFNLDIFFKKHPPAKP